MRAIGRWVKRHPFWSLLVIAVVVIAGTPGNADAAAGLAILLLPLAVTNWIIMKFRARNRKHGAIHSAPAASKEPNTPMQKGASRQTAKNTPGRAPSRAAPSLSTSGGTFAEQTKAEPLAPHSQSALAETSHRPIQPIRTAAGTQSLITLKDMLDMAPTEFEEFCVKALEGIGYKDVKRVGGAGDLAADIFATDQYGKSTIVQCKRYRPGSKIGSPTIQTFIGMKNVHHQADRGIFMTTADYSVPAIRLAKQHDLILIDGDDMVKIAGLVMAPRRLPQAQAVSSGARFCTSCGAEFDVTERFCGMCGSPRREGTSS